MNELKIKTSRKCDTCKEWSECKDSFLTERIWHCSSCEIASQYGQIILYEPEEVTTMRMIDYDGFDYLVEDDTLTSAKPIEELEFKIDKNIYITATKDDMIDISRTLSLAISIGNAEFTLSDGRKVIIKINK